MNVSQHIYSPNTRLVYGTQYRQFVQWCEGQGTWSAYAPSYPSEALCAYLEARAESGTSPTTLQLIPAAIRAKVREIGLPDPSSHKLVRLILKGARKLRNGDRRQATGLTKRGMRKIEPLSTPKQWALLKLMRDCLLRRSEAAAARWRNLEREPEGTGRLTVPYSKNDQEGKGAVLFVGRATMKAVLAIRPQFPKPGQLIFDWHPSTICRTIANLTYKAGLHGDYSGHSPRVGMAQDLARVGASLVEIQHAGRWKEPAMPAYYTRSISTGCSAVAKYQKFL